MRRITLASASLLTLASAPAAVDRCSVAQAVTGYACVQTTKGVVLADDAAEAARLAALARNGEQRWRRHFKGDVVSYAVVQTLKPGASKALHAAGFSVVLPWLSPAQYAESSSVSVRRASEAQVKAQGVTDPTRIKAVAAWQAKHPPGEWTEKEAGAVPHEIGHMWYIARYWPKSAVDGAGHYGGPGPDWMDETAAVLMEDDRLTATRRQQFSTYYADRSTEGAVARATLIDLANFLHQEHPAKALQDMVATRAAASAGPRVMVISAEEAKGKTQLAAIFYLQARSFADFLMARTGNDAVFAEISEALGRGETSEQWLAKRGRALHLGSTISDVQTNWLAWIDAPGSKSAEGIARPRSTSCYTPRLLRKRGV
jgi:hypothetical protein